MKIVITGHTSGIGDACYRHFKQHFTVVGLSRENGFDIKYPELIYSQAHDADVLINNAYSDHYQIGILEYFFSAWQSQKNKTIITVGSYCTDYPRIERSMDTEPWPYRDHKRSLEQKFRELSLTEHACNIQLIKPGPVDTPMIKTLDCVKISADAIAVTIGVMLAQPKIKELTIYE